VKPVLQTQSFLLLRALVSCLSTFGLLWILGKNSKFALKYNNTDIKLILFFNISIDIKLNDALTVSVKGISKNIKAISRKEPEIPQLLSSHRG